uniref:Fibrinogen C-terminal domain-containing protein n=1 Tax=Anisakis simplex TaxID=6269 RepID=A0A0M3J4R8_ANISI
LFKISSAADIYPWMTSTSSHEVSTSTAKSSSTRHSLLSQSQSTPANKTTTPTTTTTTTTESPKIIDERQSQQLTDDCKTLRENGAEKSGIYRLWLPKIGSFEAYCDMETDGGGWTIIQRSVVKTFLVMNKYEDGFGNLSSSYWLGLKKVFVSSVLPKLRHKSITLSSILLRTCDLRCWKFMMGFEWFINNLNA